MTIFFNGSLLLPMKMSELTVLLIIDKLKLVNPIPIIHMIPTKLDLIAESLIWSLCLESDTCNFIWMIWFAICKVSTRRIFYIYNSSRKLNLVLLKETKNATPVEEASFHRPLICMIEIREKLPMPCRYVYISV